MYLRGFVALYVRMFVARANKVEWTMSWCLGTNEILAYIELGIAKGRTRALWDSHLDSSQFFRLFLRLQVLRLITLNILIIQTLCTVMQLFKGSYSDRIRLSRTVQRTYLWVLFQLLQGRVNTLCRTKRGLGVINLKTRLVNFNNFIWFTTKYKLR